MSGGAMTATASSFAFRRWSKKKSVSATKGRQNGAGILWPEFHKSVRPEELGGESDD